MSDENIQPQEVATKIRKLDKFIEGSKKNSSSIGISASVVVSWVLTDMFGTPVPEPVIAAVAGLVSSVAATIQNGR